MSKSPFPGMDPFVEKNPLFHELHTQFLAEAQRLLQPQLRPRYLARLERHLPEVHLDDTNYEIDIDLAVEKEGRRLADSEIGNEALRGIPCYVLVRDRPMQEHDFCKQRRIVIYVNAQPRLAVTSIELLSPSNKDSGSIGQARYLEKRSSALHGGLNWVEIDLLRAGSRPPVYVALNGTADYLVYVAQATPTGRRHRVYGWKLRDALRVQSIPLLGKDQAALDLGACFQAAYDAVAADEEADYAHDPPPPPLMEDDAVWADELLKSKGLR